MTSRRKVEGTTVIKAESHEPKIGALMDDMWHEQTPEHPLALERFVLNGPDAGQAVLEERTSRSHRPLSTSSKRLL